MMRESYYEEYCTSSPYQVILAALTSDFRATLFTRSLFPVAGAAQSSTSPAKGGSFSGSACSPGPVIYLHTGELCYVLLSLMGRPSTREWLTASHGCTKTEIFTGMPSQRYEAARASHLIKREIGHSPASRAMLDVDVASPLHYEPAKGVAE